MKDTAISIQNLAKSFTIVHDQEQHATLAEAMLHRLRHPFTRMQRETFWAIKDISLQIPRGQVVGIIGRNGAGKSTLLKILSRVTEPTRGEIHLFGRVGSLLEVGTGFHPELTGRENIYLNGAILGMRRREIDQQFDAIVQFAGVEKFLDTPVKRYSSGMYVRLAFAVAAHLDSEILLIDEVLAVGDAEFQNKCLGKMKDVATSGRTVLFVSHQMQAVSALCNRVICMDSGAIGFDGDVRQGIEHYLHVEPAKGVSDKVLRRPGSGELRFSHLATDKNSYYSTDNIAVEMDVAVLHGRQPRYFISMEIVNSFGLPVLHLDSRLLNMDFPADSGRTIRYEIREPRLAQGEYRVNVYLCSSGGVIDRFENAARFTIVPLLPYPASRSDCVGNAMVYPDFAIESTPQQSASMTASAVAAEQI